MGFSHLLRAARQSPRGPSRCPSGLLLPFFPFANRPTCLHLPLIVVDVLGSVLVSIQLDWFWILFDADRCLPLSQRADLLASPGDQLNLILLITNYDSRHCSEAASISMSVYQSNNFISQDSMLTLSIVVP